MFSLLSVKSSQFVTRIYRKSSTDAAFQVNLNRVKVGWKKPVLSIVEGRSVSTNGWSRRIGGYALRALSTLHFWLRLVRLGGGSMRTGMCGVAVLMGTMRIVTDVAVVAENNLIHFTLTAASALLAVFLNRRARHGAVGAVNTAIAGFRFEHSVALPALVEPLACVGRHRLGLDVTAIGACQY